ncbi:MAG: calcium-binding protein, partial [Schwartzia sp.]|nr:calcium-binding protein [Schwartzia sp. (in: firmicutes)]
VRKKMVTDNTGAVTGTTITAASLAGDTLTGTGVADSVSIAGNVSYSTVRGESGSTITVGSAISLGGGKDTLTIGSDDPSVSGKVSGSTIIAGAEDEDDADEVIIKGTVYNASKVSLGGGDDKLTIDGGVGSSTIDAGAGGDTLSIRGNINNNSKILLGEGDNSLSALGDGGQQVACTTIVAGAGADTLEFKGYGNAAAAISFNTGAGKDRLTINTKVENNSSINTGADNDSISIGGYVSSSTIDAGTGADSVSINGAVTKAKISLDGENAGSLAGADKLTITGAVESSTIDAGADADEVSIAGAVKKSDNASLGSAISLGAGGDKLTIGSYVESSTIDAGAGADTVIINGSVSGAKISLGDGDDSGNGNTLTINTGFYDNVESSTIDAGAGKDVVSITGPVLYSSKISLGGGDDTLTIGGAVVGGNSIVTIDAGAGNDEVHIRRGVAAAKISLGGGDDTLTIDGLVGAPTTTIDAGAGNDEVNLAGGFADTQDGPVVLNLGAGEDTLKVKAFDDLTKITGAFDGGDLVVLSTEKTDDAGNPADLTTLLTIDDSGNLLIDGAASGLTVAASGARYSLKVQNGATGETATITHDVPQPAPEPTPTVPAETVNVNGKTVDVITGTDGDDNIDISGVDSVVIVSLSGGDNTVTAGGNGGDSIFAGDGNNQITVTGGTGNYIAVGNGDNTLQIAGDSATIQSGSGDDQATVAGDNAKVDLGSGDNTLALTGDDASVSAGGGSDNATVGGDNARIDLGAGDDNLTINGHGGNVSLGSSADSATVTGGSHLAIDLGSGNDALTVEGGGASISAGTGDDTIKLSGDGENHVNLEAGNNLVEMTTADGHATILGGSGDDTIRFTGDAGNEGDILDLTAGGNNVVEADETVTLNHTTIRGGSASQTGGNLISLAGAVNEAQIGMGGGNDTIAIGDAESVTINAGSGDDSIALAGGGHNVINLAGDNTNGGGRSTLSVAGGKDNTIVVGRGDNYLDLAASTGDLVTVGASEAGADTILAGNDASIAAGRGSDLIDGTAVTGTVTLLDYNAAEKDVLAGTATFTGTNGAIDASAFLGEKSVFSADGTIRTAGGGQFDAGLAPAEGDSGATVCVQDASGKTQTVWYALAYGSNADTAGQKDPMIMTGANNEAADTMMGGQGNDTLYVGTGDLAAGGKGDDTIINTGSLDTREQFGLAKGNGKDSVQNLGGGFDNTSDAVTFYESSLLTGTTASYDGKGNLVLTNGDASLTLQMAAGTDSVSAHVVLKNGLTGADERLSVLNKNATEKVTDDTAAKYYYGSKDGGSALDASEISTGVKVDLGNSGRYFEAGENYSYITAVKGSDHGDNFLAGSGATAETLTGGNGVANTLYGGGSSNDLLTGGGKDAFGVEAQDTFYFGSSDGKDVIQNIGNGDKVMLYDLKDDGSLTVTTTTLNGGSYLNITTNTGAQLFIESAAAGESYEVCFTDGVGGDVTARYEVTGTSFRKV